MSHSMHLLIRCSKTVLVRPLQLICIRVSTLDLKFDSFYHSCTLSADYINPHTQFIFLFFWDNGLLQIYYSLLAEAQKEQRQTLKECKYILLSFNINPATGRSEQGLAGVVKPKTTHFFRTPQMTYASIHYYQIHMPSVISLAIDQVWVRQSVLLSPLVSLLCLRQNLDLFYFWSYRKLANTCCY